MSSVLGAEDTKKGGEAPPWRGLERREGDSQVPCQLGGHVGVACVQSWGEGGGHSV